MNDTATRPLPSIERCPLPAEPCRHPIALMAKPCPNQAAYRVWWAGGRGGKSPILRDVCVEHGTRWAEVRGLRVPPPREARWGMILARFRSENHPQQVAKRGPRPEIDLRATPPELFNPLQERFGFTLDAAALPSNAKVPRYFTPEQDGLVQNWAGYRVFVNPPYSNIEAWVARAWSQQGACPLIVMLLPANRTEQGWWQIHVEPFRDRPGSPLRVEFMKDRRRFIKHGATEIGKNERPPFGVCLLIWDNESRATK